jgi:16S rRNA (guanine966-N2)-methyltransferase
MANARGRRPNSVRIIGGSWGGRRLRFPAAPGLRPTSDRRRETLFNWLAPDLPGARCLDLFAGSGALGFEAVSRGAASAVLVEASRVVATALGDSRAALDAGGRIEIVHARVARFLARPAEPFDIVFVDPPFDQPDLAAAACEELAGGWLAPAASVYLEVTARAERPRVPSTWHLRREMVSADAQALLFSGDAPA